MQLRVAFKATLGTPESGGVASRVFCCSGSSPSVVPVLNGVGADGVGATFPIMGHFQVNRSCLLLFRRMRRS